MDRENITNEQSGSFLPIEPEAENAGAETKSPVGYSEILPREPEKKKKRRRKDPAKRRLIAFGAVTVAVCILLSFLSGAAGSYLVMCLYPLAQLTPGSVQSNSDIPEYITLADETTGVSEFTAENSETVPTETTAAWEETTLTAEPTTEKPEPTTLPPTKLTKGEIYAQAVNSIVGIKAITTVTYATILGRTISRDYQSSGSGFFIRSDGYILTNRHVVEGADKITVTTYEGRELRAKIVGSEKANDIAVLKVQGSFTPVELGDSDSLAVGDDILVIGNALGQLSYTFTDGVVSFLSRAVSTESGVVINMFQTNAAINQGNSGGPVYNGEGEVIGIASAKYASNSVEGLSFCIPINDVKQLADKIIEKG